MIRKAVRLRNGRWSFSDSERWMTCLGVIPNDASMVFNGNSVKILLDRVTAEPNLRDRVEVEARQLTEIGNNFFIRHTEISKPPIADSHQVDYLFHLLFSFIRLILQSNGVPM
jgi:hypothetical protein